MNRLLKQRICVLLASVFLFAQLAVAAYACPQLSPAAFGQSSDAALMVSDRGQAGSDANLAASPIGEVPAGCDGMGQPDPDQPNLCAQHGHFGQQSDQTQTPTVPALASLYIVSLVPELPAPIRPTTGSAWFLAAASPPHAILHCCFRN